MNPRKSERRIELVTDHYMDLIQNVKASAVNSGKELSTVQQRIDVLNKDLEFILNVFTSYEMVGGIDFERDLELDGFTQRIIEATQNAKPLQKTALYNEFKAEADEIFGFFAVKYLLEKINTEYKVKREIIKNDPFYSDSYAVSRLHDEEETYTEAEVFIKKNWDKISHKIKSSIAYAKPLNLASSGEDTIRLMGLEVLKNKLTKENFTYSGIDYQLAKDCVKKLESMVSNRISSLDLDHISQ